LDQEELNQLQCKWDLPLCFLRLNECDCGIWMVILDKNNQKIQHRFPYYFSTDISIFY
jgi:hypothetical protein